MLVNVDIQLYSLVFPCLYSFVGTGIPRKEFDINIHIFYLFLKT